MLKSQISREPWPVNSWMPFIFQPAFWALQQPHKHSHSLQLTNHTELAHYYIQLALSTLHFFLSPRGFLQSTPRPHHSTARPLERATRHIKVTHPPCLFWLRSWENINRSTTLIYLLCERHHLINFCERIPSMPCFLPLKPAL